MHGNEPAGVLALQQVLGSLHASHLPFRGRFVGLAGNRAALARGCRYIDQDFNRLWSPERVRQLKRQERSADTGAEDAEQRELLEEIEAQLTRRHGPVVFLDLHTTSAAGQPFVVIGDTLLNRRFAFPPPGCGDPGPGRTAGGHAAELSERARPCRYRL